MALILIAILTVIAAPAQAGDLPTWTYPPEVRALLEEDWLSAYESLDTGGQWPSVDDALTWAPADRWSMKTLTVPPGRVHITPTGTIIRWTETPAGIVPERIGTDLYRHHVSEPGILWPFFTGLLALGLGLYLRVRWSRRRDAAAGAAHRAETD